MHEWMFLQVQTPTSLSSICLRLCLLGALLFGRRLTLLHQLWVTHTHTHTHTHTRTWNLTYTRHRASTSMYSLTFHVTTPPAIWTKWNSVVADNVAHAAGTSTLSLVSESSPACVVCAVGLADYCWALPCISSVTIATRPVHRLQIRSIVHN